MKWLDLDHEKSHSHVFLCQNTTEGNTHTFAKPDAEWFLEGADL